MGAVGPGRWCHMTEELIEEYRRSYDGVAAEYAEKFFHELEYKPLDRSLLERLVANVGKLGPLCDLGCGPGQIARYLKDHGADALGVDLSPRMIEVARKLSPDVPFQVGNMLALPFPAQAWGGIAAFYSLIHIPRSQIMDALRELGRVLRPGGWLLLAFHVGDETVHVDEFFEQSVNLDFNFLQTGPIKELLRQAGFTVEECLERDPYPQEHPSRRAYIFARKPDGTD